jgi:hypothetical protein
MTAKDTVISGYVTEVERRGNTRNGNPRWIITTDPHGPIALKGDSQCAYMVTYGLVGKLIQMTLTPSGREIRFYDVVRESE